MKRTIMIIASIAIACCRVNAQSEESKNPMTPEAYDVMRGYYYLNPSPNIISAAIDFMDKEGIPSKENDMNEIVGFFAEVFAGNPESLPKWRESVSRTHGDTQSALLNAIRYSENMSLLTMFDPTKDSAKNNDLCWGAFYASGKDIYIKALIGRLAYLDETSNFRLFATAASAQWSLSGNARHHSRVKSILLDAVSTSPPDIKKALKDALEKEPDQFREIHLRQWVKGQKEKPAA